MKRGEKVPEKERRPENPLLVRDVVVFPNLGDPITKSAKEVGFYFAAYTVKGGPAPESAIELVQNGKSVALVPLPLSSADSDGRIQQRRASADRRPSSRHVRTSRNREAGVRADSALDDVADR